MHTSRLPNGLRVVTVPLHDTKAVTVFVFTKVGSRHETKALNGVSHFIEHLMFKGTKKRPNTLAISRLLDGVGAQYNAFTSKDWTGYYVKINSEKTDVALDIVSDMLRNSKFDAAEIQRERGVIIEEINMYEDNPLMLIEDIFESVVFGDHHPLGWSIAGPREVIHKVSRASMLRYRNQYYHAKNMWVVVAGKLQPNIQSAIKTYFAPIKGRSVTPKSQTYRPSAANERVHLKYRDSEQIQIGLGVKAFSYTDKRLPALSLLSIILGGNMSSRLFIQIRERRGLAYSVHASVNPYEDTGCFMIQAGLEKTRLSEALRVMVAELKRLKNEPVSTAELKRAKEYIRGKMVLDLEDSDSLAYWYGRQAVFQKKIETPEESLKKIAPITTADIQRVAQDLFRPAAMRLAVIGPFKDPQPYAQIIKTV